MLYRYHLRTILIQPPIEYFNGMQNVASSDNSTQETLSPAYWRQWADKAREAARDVHPLNRQILEDVAISYEEMAQLVEDRHPKPTKRRPIQLLP